MLKKYLLVFSLVFFYFNSNAGHEEGGVIINYRSLASLNGDSLEYEVTVYSIYSLAGISAPTTFSVNLSSSCFPNSNISLPRISSSSGGLLPLLGADYCAPSLNISANSGLGLYKDTIILPGKCADFRFSVSSGFGRYNFTANIASSFGTNYFFVTLDNMSGPNSCPQVEQSDILQAACLLKPLNLYGFTDPDGDSLVFKPSTPLNISGPTITALSYSLGYSQSNPVNSPTGYSMDPLTGVVNTTLNTVGAFAIGIKFEEYRLDTALGVKVLIAKGRFIMNLIGASSCSPLPIKIDHSLSSNSDSVQCGDKFIQFRTTRKADQSSLTSTGSEFDISSNRNPALSVIAAQFLSDTIIEIELNQTINSNDTILLSMGDGTDTNTVYSICGKEVDPNSDTLRFYSSVTTPINSQFTYSSNLLDINFQSGTADSIVWNFGDGTPVLINSNSPNHIYSAPGTYNVQLTVYNFCGDMWSSSQTIIVCDSIEAHLNYSISGDTLFFDANASFGANNFHWNFGDGDSALIANGRHVFTSGGTYTVIFTAENDCGDTSIISFIIETCIQPVAWWTYSIVSTTQNGMIVNFNGSSSTNATRYIWDFGDGTLDSSSLSPSHTYLTPSLSYLVSLTIYNSCSDMANKTYRLDQIGLEEASFINSIQVYPNPAQNNIHISWDAGIEKELSLILYSLEGKVVLESTLGGEMEGDSKVDVSQLSPGYYTLRILGGNNILNKKVLIKQ